MTRSALRSLVSLALVSLAACSTPTAGNSSTGNTGNTGGAGGSGGAGGGGPFGDTTSTGAGGFEACATSAEDAARVPVSMFLAVDKSGSMGDNGKLAHVKAAFDTFFADPEAASLSVALRVFPEGQCSPPACNVDACATPDVDLGALSDPAQVQALTGKLASVSPGGNTPMSTALHGATKWAMNRSAQVGQSEKVVVVLVTDGEPHGCINDVDQIAANAKKAYDGDGVLTFAVGLVGSNQATMDTIAQAGHTDQGFFIGNGNTEADSISALHTIQTTSASCVYAMPKAAPGDTLDPTRVNVTYLPGGAMTPETMNQVAGAASCGPGGGWYYDNPGKPSFITLCPSTCDAAKADESAKIQIVLGCATQVK